MSEDIVDVIEVDPAVEREARDMGWVPQDEFRGPEDKWRSADEFVERGREILPILRKNKEELLKQNRQLRADIDEMKGTFEEFKEYRKQDRDRAYKQALDDLKSRKIEAIGLNDGELVVEIDEAIAEIKEEAAKPQEPIIKKVETPAVDPIFTEWVEDNEWFVKNTALQYAANAAGAEIQETNPELKGRKFLNKVTELVKERYPEKFAVKRDQPATVEGSTGSSVRSVKKKSYDTLPAEAKTACDKYVKQGLMTREEYVKEFEWN